MKSKYSIFILATISIYLGIIETTNTFAQSPYDSDIIFNEYDIVMDLDFASNAVEFEVRICANNLSKVDKTFIDCGLCTITNNREIVVRNLNVFQMRGD
ncbi:MAG: hypothetical protein JXR73_13880, partial [Candidatus Omnitrophica bacterium]|nr:hypothetical protein [Candidatus Omnitrophota bacterium]